MSPKVWPIQATQLDTSTAKKYGDIQRPMCSVTEYPTGEDGDAYQKKLQIIGEILHAAAEFDPMTDFLLLVGDPILIGLAFGEVRDTLKDAEVDQLSVLRYDKKLGRYLEIVVEL